MIKVSKNLTTHIPKQLAFVNQREYYHGGLQKRIHEKSLLYEHKLQIGSALKICDDFVSPLVF